MPRKGPWKAENPDRQLLWSKRNLDILESDNLVVESNLNENELITQELKLKEEISRLHEQLQRKDCEHNTNIMELEAQINELELLSRQKVCSVENVKDNNKLFRPFAVALYLSVS